MALKKKRNKRSTNLVVVLLIILVVLLLGVVFFSDNISFVVVDTEIPQREVIFEEDVSDSFNFLYDSLRGEYAACLKGKTVGNVTTITSFDETDIVGRSNDHIVFKQCSNTRDFIGTLHSHPQPDTPGFVATCDLSKQDTFSFGLIEEDFACVQCGVNEFKCYTPDNLVQGIEVQNE